jgi:hypothetical protein
VEHGEALGNIQAGLNQIANTNALTPIQFANFKQSIDAIVEVAAPAVMAAAEAAQAEAEKTAEEPKAESNGKGKVIELAET